MRNKMKFTVTKIRSQRAGETYRIAYGGIKCTCLTKTPDVMYHTPECEYRKYVEELNESS